MKETSGKASRSVILEGLIKLTEKFYSLLIHSFIGRLFTAYSAEENMLRESRLFSRFRNAKKTERIASSLKLKMARAFENSFFLDIMERLTASLIYRKLKTFGAFFLSLGAYGMITYIIQRFALGDTTIDERRFFICAILLFVSLPLISSKETLAQTLLNSKLLSPLLYDGLGFARDAFNKQIVFPKRYALVTALGMALGVLTFYIDPLFYVMVAVVVIAVLLIFRHPEVGIVLWITLLPCVGFLEHASLILASLVLVTDVSYIVKLIRGKRSFRMRLMDYPVLLLSVVYFLGGVFSKGGVQSFYSALMYIVLLSGYFLVFNLIRTRQWIRRCVVMGVLSGAVACLVGIVQIFTGTLNSSWLDTSMFSGIGTRIVSSFDNPNVFAEYLLLMIPFALAGLLKKGNKVHKLFYGTSLLVMLVCLVFTWSRGAWLGFLVSMLVFFVIFSKRSIVGLLGVIVVSPLLSWLVPSAVSSRFLSIGNLADSSTSYRISAWHGIVELLHQTKWSGIGVGSAAFEATYPSVALAGTQTIKHAHSIYLQLLAELGIPGLLVFLLTVFLFVQSCFEYFLKVKNQEERVFVIAGVAAVAAMLVMGVTDHIWYSYRIFLAFWTLVALVNSSIQYGFSVFDRYHNYENNTQYASVLEIGTEEL
ncbi:MAG: O-antigen ligase family protein [Clostridia bacterium]|nr:O-antigen ligase family protein [Clostridia bacterium]